MNTIDLLTHSSIKTKPRSHSCRCKQVIVHEHTRMLSCQQCERTIDPFDWMLQQGKSQERLAFDVQAKRNEVDKLCAEIEDLKRIKRNLQSSNRRLNLKEGS